MDLRQLRHFATVAETLHFGEAARRLHMTQPPLSQSIMALEQELGAALFLRTRRHVELTPFGEQWLVHVRPVLAGMAALPEQARQLRDGETGRLELSFVSIADYSLLPRLVQRYASLYPEVELVLTEATSDVQIAALRKGQGHAGIVIAPEGGMMPAGLSYERLLLEPLLAAVPESWVNSGRLVLTGDRLSPAAVITAPLVVFPRQLAPAFHDLVLGYYHAFGSTPLIGQQAIQMQTIISLVSAGMGIALVPASLRHLARTGVRYVELLAQAPTLETGLIWRSADTSPTLARFLSVARNEAKTPSGESL